MPLLKVQINQPINSDLQDDLMKELSKDIVEMIGKPEKYMMVTFEQAAIIMGGETSAAAFVEVRSIGGLTPEVNRNLSDKIGHILSSKLDISGDRIYINFIDISRTHWGWNRSTFG